MSENLVDLLIREVSFSQDSSSSIMSRILKGAWTACSYFRLGTHAFDRGSFPCGLSELLDSPHQKIQYKYRTLMVSILVVSDFENTLHYTMFLIHQTKIIKMNKAIM